MTRLKTIPLRLKSAPHARKQISDSWRAGKTNSTARGYGYKWQQARAAYLLEYPHCVMCLAEVGMTGLHPADVIVRCAQLSVPEPVATVVNHKIAHRGNQRLFWDRSNWESLCKPHHDSDAQRVDKRGSQRPRIGPDGYPVED